MKFNLIFGFIILNQICTGSDLNQQSLNSEPIEAEIQAIEQLLTALWERGVIQVKTEYNLNSPLESIVKKLCEEEDYNNFLENHARYQAGSKEYSLNLRATLLLLAVRSGKPEWCKRLTEHGASTEAACVDESEQPVTPLILAMRLLNPDMVEVLLSQGAKIHQPTKRAARELPEKYKHNEELSQKAEHIATILDNYETQEQPITQRLIDLQDRLNGSQPKGGCCTIL